MITHERIAWTTKATGFEGCGHWLPADQMDFQAQADSMDRAYPEIKHRVEELEELEESQEGL